MNRILVLSLSQDQIVAIVVASLGIAAKLVEYAMRRRADETRPLSDRIARLELEHELDVVRAELRDAEARISELVAERDGVSGDDA